MSLPVRKFPTFFFTKSSLKKRNFQLNERSRGGKRPRVPVEHKAIINKYKLFLYRATINFVAHAHFLEQRREERTDVRRFSGPRPGDRGSMAQITLLDRVCGSADSPAQRYDYPSSFFSFFFHHFQYRSIIDIHLYARENCTKNISRLVACVPLAIRSN